MRTSQAQLGAESELDDDDEDAQGIVSKRDEDQVTANKSILFQAWLWFQFAIVVVIFIFAMARKGPGVVLGGGERVGKERRAVARR
jgi:cytochrome oxidase assembly protein ShyY1